MNRQLSVYLDLLRFIAAFMVFLSHVSGFTGGVLWQLGGWGHEAVVFFFVLSGFVIAFVCFEKKETALEYTVNRFSRIYSVALPALCLTIILYYWGKEIDIRAFTVLDERLVNPAWTTFSALTFLNQSWVATTIFTNMPYWSLSYEVLYYVIFGVFIFTKGYRRLGLILLILGAMGPSILLYLPIWLMGVLCFKYTRKYTIFPWQAWFMFAVSLIGIIVFSQSAVQIPINQAVASTLGGEFMGWLLEPAEQFGADYILGVFVALHIMASSYVGRNMIFFNETVARKIREMSSHTFSLYLYHMPMLFAVAALFPYEQYPKVNIVSCLVFVPLLIFLLSHFTEKKKSSYKFFFLTIYHIFFRSTYGDTRATYQKKDGTSKR